MCAKRVEEFTIWQLGVELRRMIIAVTERESFKRDFKLFHQIRGAAASIPANIAEGFARYSPAEFARFVRYARGSAAELEMHLQDAFERGHIMAAEHQTAAKLCRRIAAGSCSLLRYLAQSKTGEPKRHTRPRRPRSRA